MMTRLVFFFGLILLAQRCNADGAIRIVGSSSIYPFISIIAEEFGKFSSFKTPIVESVGSGAGFKMFCSGIGINKPDITTSSRPIKSAEIDFCHKNGVTDISEIILGYDGIVLANSKESAQFDFTKNEIFTALFMYDINKDINEKNQTQYWSEISNSLPNYSIEVYGPNKNTGTYTAILDMIFMESCLRNKNVLRAYTELESQKNVCTKIRDDGRYIEGTANENIIIQKIFRNKEAIGIFSFSFLIKNSDYLQGSKIAGVLPNYENISSNRYPLSRPLYVYVKKQHLGVTTGLAEFLKEMVSVKSIGSRGYLASSGLIPLSDEEIQKQSDLLFN